MAGVPDAFSEDRAAAPRALSNTLMAPVTPRLPRLSGGLTVLARRTRLTNVPTCSTCGTAWVEDPLRGAFFGEFAEIVVADSRRRTAGPLITGCWLEDVPDARETPRRRVSAPNVVPTLNRRCGLGLRVP